MLQNGHLCRPMSVTEVMVVGRKPESRAVIRVRPRMAGGARHAYCCVFAHDDHANLLGLHFFGLLFGILGRCSPSSAEHGRAADARE